MGRSQVGLDNLVVRSPQVESAGVFVAHKSGCMAGVALPPWVVERLLKP